MRVRRIVDLDLYFRSGPRAVTACSVAESYRELILVRADAADGLARSQRHGHLGFSATGIHQPLHQSQTFLTCGHAREVSRSGVTRTTLTGAIEVLLTLLDIASGKVLRVDALA